MLGGKLITIIIGLLLAIIAACNMDYSKPVVEGWWGNGSFTATAVPGACVGGRETALGGNYLDQSAMMGSNKFISVPSFQAVLSPRFSNVQYGANIRYNAPDRENMATPCDPLTFGEMAQENYAPDGRVMHGNIEGFNGVNRQAGDTRENFCANCGTGGCGGGCPASCGKGGIGMGHKIAGGYDLPVGYTNGNFQDVYDSLPGNVVSRPCQSGKCGSNTSDLPIGTMSAMDGNGNTDQFIAFNRIMTTNKKSRLWGLADLIRGDLAITPDNGLWFQVHPTINTDLNTGAMNVMGGGGGESYNNMLKLVHAASGGTYTTMGGVDLAQESPYHANMVGESITSLSQAMGGTVNVTAFP